MNSPLKPEQLAALKSFDTCMVANAVETFNVRLRNEGFMNSSVRCFTSCASPMVGYAVTLKVQCSHPPMEGRTYIDRTEWWNWLADLPKPSVLVIQDVDERPGTGAFIGETHAAIFQALGCVGVVTNGAVRDLPAVEKRGFHLFAGSVAVSHAYAHKVDYGKPVKVAGLDVAMGDLLHADVHGVLSIPHSIAPEIPFVAERIRAHERRILDAVQRPDISIEELRDTVKGYFST